VNDGVVILEHVDFLDVLQLLHAELLNGRLQFLVHVDLLMVNNLLGPSLSAY